MTLTQQWRYLNLGRNGFYNLLPAKGIMSYRQIMSSRLYVRLKQGSPNYGPRSHFVNDEKIIH